MITGRKTTEEVFAELLDLHPAIKRDAVFIGDIIYIRNMVFIGQVLINFADKHNALWDYVECERDTIKLWWR